MPRKIDFEKAAERFKDRNDIELCKDGWTGWKTKSKFYDLVIKEHFFVEPEVAYRNKASHPKRRAEKSATARRLSFNEANERFADRNDIKLCEESYISWDKKATFYDFVEKAHWEAVPKKVHLRKSVHPNRMSDKRKEVCLEKYGTICPLQSQQIKNKTEKTMLEKFGVTHFSKTDEFRQRVVDNNTNRIIKETGETVVSWFEKQSEPKPAKSHIRQIVNNDVVSLLEMENILRNYRDNKTTLEVLAEKIFGKPHFNKKPKELTKIFKPDFKLSDKVYINVDGLYWHSEKNKYSNYHFDMRKEFEDNNLRLIQFHEDEIRNKAAICKSIVSNTVGKTLNKAYARKCKVQTIDSKKAKVFLEENHLMGNKKSKHIGLLNEENIIVCLLSYKQKDNVCKIERFCSLLDTNVIGGFSKLLSYLEKNCLNPGVNEIHNWVDLRYGTGSHLLNKSFLRVKDNLGWKWTDGINSFNRLRCRAGMDHRRLTQQQHADELGWFKIYDAGQRLYIKNIK